MGRRGGGSRGGGGGMFGGSKKSSGGGLFSRSKAAPPARSASTQRKRQSPPPPAPAASAPPPAAPQQGGGGGMLGSIGSTIVQGMAFGTGSAVAHRAVDSVMGPREVKHVHEGGPEGGEPMAAAPEAGGAMQSGGVCPDEMFQFQQCQKDNAGDLASCKFYFDVLSQCQQNSSNDSRW